MRKVEFSRFRETLYTETLPNGLSVFLFPKPGFAQVQAMFTTDYGSIDSHFRLANEEGAIHVPDGIAHFLEHKMFESKDEPVFTKFARYGGSVNAFTSFAQTTYYFSSTSNTYENLGTLLDFVQDPYFTEENVEKEKGIIAQEIRMGEDNPDRRSYYGLLGAMYQKHPLRIEIAGTVESIYQITHETLYRCYRTFYHPSNMILVVAGGFEPDEMMAFIEGNQQTKTFGEAPQIERIFPDEPTEVGTRESSAKLSVSQPRAMMGWKDRQVGLVGNQLIERDMLTSIVLDAMFGQSSPLYHQLIDDELIDQHFGWEYEITPRYGYSLLGGDTPSPERLQERILRFVEEVKQNGLSEASFNRCRKKMMGWVVTMFDSPGQVARQFTAYHLRNADVFQMMDVLESLTLSMANERLRDHFQTEQYAVSIVLPNHA